MENTTVSNYSVTQVTGKIIKGTKQDSYKDAKGVTKTMVRIEDKALVEMKGFTNFKTTVNYQEFATVWQDTDFDTTIETLAAACGEPEGMTPDQLKIREFLIDLIDGQKQKMLGDVIRKQPDITFIDLSLDSLINHVTAEVKRGRQASGINGDMWKANALVILDALVKYASEKSGKTIAADSLTTTVNQFKILVTTPALLATDKQIDTLKGIGNKLPEGELKGKWALMVEAKEALNMVNELDLF